MPGTDSTSSIDSRHARVSTCTGQRTWSGELGVSRCLQTRPPAGKAGLKPAGAICIQVRTPCVGPSAAARLCAPTCSHTSSSWLASRRYCDSTDTPTPRLNTALQGAGAAPGARRKMHALTHTHTHIPSSGHQARVHGVELGLPSCCVACAKWCVQPTAQSRTAAVSWAAVTHPVSPATLRWPCGGNRQ